MWPCRGNAPAQTPTAASSTELPHGLGEGHHPSHPGGQGKEPFPCQRGWGGSPELCRHWRLRMRLGVEGGELCQRLSQSASAGAVQEFWCSPHADLPSLCGLCDTHCQMQHCCKSLEQFKVIKRKKKKKRIRGKKRKNPSSLF